MPRYANGLHLEAVYLRCFRKALSPAGDKTGAPTVVAVDWTILWELRRFWRSLWGFVFFGHHFFSMVVSLRPGSRPSLMTLFAGNVGRSGTEACGAVVTGAGVGVSCFGIANLT